MIETHPDTQLTDEQIVERVLAGEVRLYEILMRRYNQRLFRISRAILRDDEEAVDVMQDAYVRAYAHLGQFASRARFATWLSKIAVHEALARARQRLRVTELRDITDLDEGMTASNPEKALFSSELAGLLESALDALAASYRAVFMMRAVEELSTAETAECLGISQDAVKVRLHRARAAIRDEIADRVGASAVEAFRFDGARCDRVVAGVLARIP
jgi:RNA polymerase sigma-70 factor (ECF subfamily)